MCVCVCVPLTLLVLPYLSLQFARFHATIIIRICVLPLGQLSNFWSICICLTIIVSWYSKATDCSRVGYPPGCAVRLRGAERSFCLSSPHSPRRSHLQTPHPNHHRHSMGMLICFSHCIAPNFQLKCGSSKLIFSNIFKSLRANFEKLHFYWIAVKEKNMKQNVAIYNNEKSD